MEEVVCHSPWPRGQVELKNYQGNPEALKKVENSLVQTAALEEDRVANRGLEGVAAVHRAYGNLVLGCPHSYQGDQVVCKELAADQDMLQGEDVDLVDLGQEEEDHFEDLQPLDQVGQGASEGEVVVVPYFEKCRP